MAIEGGAPRNWMISGVSGGLGKALAVRALQEGGQVIGTVRRSDQGAQFEGLAPGRAIALEFDVTDLDAITKKVPPAIEHVGGIDVLVNNAGYSLIGAVEDTSIDEARKIMDTNFFGALQMIQTVLPHFRERRRGHIVNIASVASTIGFPWSAMYSASKSALSALTESLAQEVADFGVSVSCVEPGGIRTNFAGSGLALVGQISPVYRDKVYAVQRQYAAAATRMKNDPNKVAAVLHSVVELTEPPVRVAIGEDAHEMIERALNGRLEGYCSSRDFTVGTQFDD
ncbi:SDR family NAD(P)-dependent oxidoreductase [Rhodococcoides fascians]|uniref:SDR family NAD(P)-dependent oxidoreductase n=1 Tax=Rhodococcoides fascians TaxID=1828 RepID=UPI00050C5384|nr:SDR family NAD(P)-dependent oxidoreductase [Rhodococcus fascians]